MNNILKPIIVCFSVVFWSTGILCGQSGSPAPYGPIPSPAQLKWHETEMYAMICFGLNTYTDQEWGYGDVDPKLFNPEFFNAEQITNVLKEAGFKGLLLVAKHHDGFCLWPTTTTAYSIAASPWKEGKGDMVKEFETATRKVGLKFGLYNSPWDRNSSTYGTPAYIDIYREQLNELNSNYGPLFISWFDGANGGDGYYGGARETRKIDRFSYYGWQTTWSLIRQKQPEAVIFSDIGPDVRWVGNEKGIASETSWSTFTPKGGTAINKPALGDSRYKEAPSGHRDGKYWIPAECDVPLRPGWYYHASQDSQVKTPAELFDIYFKSVGRGAALDLGIAPDKRGLLHDNDVKALKGFGDLLKQTFSANLLAKATITTSNIRGGEARFGPENLLDNNRNTYWATDDSVTTPEFIIKLKIPQRFNIIQLREYIALGQRIEAFAVDIWKDNVWEEVAQGTSVGAQRLLRMPAFVSTDRIRVRILKSPVSPVLSDFAVFAEPDSLLASVIQRKEIVSTPKKDWRILSAPGGANKAKALIEDSADIWQGPFDKKNSFNNQIIIDMGAAQEISGILFTPPSEAFSAGLMDKYRYSVSLDGINWQEEIMGELGNIRANPLQQIIPFAEKRTVRYIKFIPIHLTDEGAIIRIAELSTY
ncbi:MULTISPECIES: alpha-L-fucosidase [Sphingobacterium]|uniref:alpha-L-fucosidase n=1 Tax=Sphingobacterium TaxID=28453 RepID=UPI0013DA51DD|nr:MULTISPECIES: alpha-L-fucosidase [unclassified Sphingobacterium]